MSWMNPFSKEKKNKKNVKKWKTFFYLFQALNFYFNCLDIKETLQGLISLPVWQQPLGNS